MSEILKINGAEVKIGESNGEVVTVPIASLQFSNPQVGDKVEVFRDGKEYIVRREHEAVCENSEGTRTINKHVFVWVGNFLFGSLGVDRFMRGQTGLGILKLLLSTIGWITIIGGLAGWIWTLTDWIVSMTKAYGSAYASTENLTFDENGNYTN